MNRKIALFLTALLMHSLFIQAQSGWTLKKDEEGIKVYSRSATASKYDEMKVETEIPATLSSLAALLLDIGNYPQWSFNNKQAYIIKQESPSDLYFYSEIHSPWPASNRDLVVHLRISQDPSTRVLTIHADAVPHLIPAKENLVRVPVSTESWTVTPQANGSLRIEYQLSIDPGGNAPAWLINNFSTKGPYETFYKLRQQVQLPKYHDAKFNFIKN